MLLPASRNPVLTSSCGEKLTVRGLLVLNPAKLAGVGSIVFIAVGPPFLLRRLTTAAPASVQWHAAATDSAHAAPLPARDLFQRPLARSARSASPQGVRWLCPARS